MRATIETHENSDRLPPVHVMVSLGDEDVSIKVRTDQLFFLPLKVGVVTLSLFTLLSVAPCLCLNRLCNLPSDQQHGSYQVEGRADVLGQ